MESTNEPVAIEPSQFLEFVGRRGLTLVFVSVHPGHPYHPTLVDELARDSTSEIAFGRIDILELLLWSTPALPFLHAGLAACGAPSALGVAPGYWLFRAGQLLAWDSGLPSTAEAKGISPSALLVALWSAFTRDVWLVGQALHLATEPATARRIAARFRAAAAEPRPEGERAPPPRPPSPLEELIRAHRILGVPPTATNREVEAAWRKKRAEYHPDRAAQDPDEFERRSRISVELNWARDLIFSHRAGSARKPAA